MPDHISASPRSEEHGIKAGSTERAISELGGGADVYAGLTAADEAPDSVDSAQSPEPGPRENRTEREAAKAAFADERIDEPALREQAERELLAMADRMAGLADAMRATAHKASAEALVAERRYHERVFAAADTIREMHDSGDQNSFPLRDLPLSDPDAGRLTTDVEDLMGVRDALNAATPQTEERGHEGSTTTYQIETPDGGTIQKVINKNTLDDPGTLTIQAFRAPRPTGQTPVQ